MDKGKTQQYFKFIQCLHLNKERINQLANNIDKTNEINEKRLLKSKVKFTVDENELGNASFHIVTVPTPIDEYNKPGFKYIISASELLGKLIMLIWF